MSGIGLLFTSASVFQMLRGSILVPRREELVRSPVSHNCLKFYSRNFEAKGLSCLAEQPLIRTPWSLLYRCVTCCGYYSSSCSTDYF